MRIIKSLINKLISAWINATYNDSKYISEQEDIFRGLGFSYSDSVRDVSKIYEEEPRLYNNMSSCHHKLFVEIKKKRKINKILEIGTYDGVNAVFLSRVFEDAEITTIDLPDEDPAFIKSYNRGDKLRDFIKSRDALLSDSKKINFKQMNSLELIFSEEMYDLIWVDGAHGYPIAAVDIANSLRMLSDDGFILCDDIFIKPIKSDKMYYSTAGYDTIKALSKINRVDYSLTYKRIARPHAHPFFRKYIAILQKSNKSVGATGHL